MKIKIIYLLICTILTSTIILSCAGNSKLATSEQDIADLQKLVDGKKFQIEFDYAYPLPSTALNSIANAGLLAPGNTPNQISLIGNPNLLKIQGDSIKAQLPYYGERQFGGAYNSRSVGIDLNGLLDDLQVDFDKKKNKYRLRFDAYQGTENYQIILDLFTNKEVYMNVNSSQRRNIAYRGKIKAIK